MADAQCQVIDVLIEDASDVLDQSNQPFVEYVLMVTTTSGTITLALQLSSFV